MAPGGHDNHAFTIDGKVGASQTWGDGEGRRRARWTCCQVTLLVLASVSVVVGVAMLAGGFQAIFDTVLKQEMEVVEGSRAYKMWRLTPVPLFLHLYFFNITNAEEFQAGHKAILKEVGPYCYREYHEKQNISFHDNKVTFLQQRWWVWDQAASGNHSIDDPIVNLNTIPISAAWSVRHSKTLLSGLNVFLKQKNEPLIHTAKAGDIIFEGYEDPMLDWMQNLPDLPPGFDLPPGLTDYDKFAWFYKRNLSLTYDGEFTMHNGHDTLDTLGNVAAWNGENVTDFFGSPCNRVGGSAGEMWPRNQQKDMIEFYSADLCMTMPLTYDREMEDANGVAGFRYSATSHTFANETVVTGNECYCVKGTCAPTGLLNAESCRMGSPAFISFPHFLHADPFLLDTVEGLSPNISDHQFYIDLIPELGIPINVAARMQINMHVTPYPGGLLGIGKIDMLSQVSEVYLPLLWFETIAALPHKEAKELKALLYVMKSDIMTIIFSLVVGLGLLAIICVLIYHFKFAAHK